MIQVQNLRSTILSQLKTKSTQNSTYRKALTIYQSILQSTRQIPNFQNNYANTDNNFALFVFGSVFKLLLKNSSHNNNNSNMNNSYNIDGMLMIINMMIDHINIGAIRNNGILKQLQLTIYNIITNTNNTQQKTPLLLRLSISILGYTLINTQKIQSDKQAIDILYSIFDISVQSHRTNILSKQSSKMLIHVVKQNPQSSKILSKYATNTMLLNNNIQNNLYLNNIRQVITQFPLQLINDIGYRISKHLSTIQSSNSTNTQDQQTYLAQTYYFLQKLVNKFTISTLQQICKQLINNLPISAKSQSKVVYCYIQTLHTIFQNLVIMNQRSGYKYFSAVISILQQYITKGGRVQKQAAGVLRAIMGSCIRKSLWVNSSYNDEQDIFKIEGMGLQQTRGSNFSRVICMLQGMLSQQYPNYKATAGIIQAFFNNLDKSSIPHILNFINKIISFRNKFDDKSFKKIIQSIFNAISIKQMCQLYKISVNGDIGSQNFEQQNNLWLLYCTQKYEGQQQFNTFMIHYYPLLLQLKNITTNNKNLSSIRVQAYKNLIEMIWRCFKIFCRIPDCNYNYDVIIQTIKKQLDQVNDSTLEHISMGLYNLCSSLHKQQYQCKWAGNLISILAKSLNIQKNNSKQILQAMKYLSAIADKQYLTRVFDKNIVKIIQQKQKQMLTHPDNVNNNLKNLQILIAVSHGINFYDPSVVAPYRISRQELVIKLIQYLINQNSLFQKKAYKYIFETLGLMGQSYLNQVIELLESNQHKIMSASKHYRLAILMYLWNKLSKNQQKINQAFEFMKKYLPQILMDMRQSNQRARRQATALFDSFCTKILEMQLMQSFVQIMCAGLAVDAVQTKISTLNGLTQIFHRKYEMSLQFAIGILEIVLMLLYQQKSQIYKAVIDFCRRFIFFAEKTKQIQHILSTILQQLFKADISSKLDNRSVLKHLLLKLTKKFGRQNTQKYIPAEDRKILSNAIKIQNRQKRKKRQRLIKRRQQLQKARKEKNQSQQSDDQNQQLSQQQQHQQMGQKMDIEGQDNQQLRQLQNTDNLLLKYDLQKQNFHFEQDKLHIKNKQRKQKNMKKDQQITFEDGIMVVKQKQDPRRKRQHKLQQQLNKQQDQQHPDARAYLNIKKRRKLNDVHEVKQSGATFRSERAGGDVKIKDKPQPYAFIQFNSKALNKRFKKRAQKVFDTIFQRSEGGLKGIKSKIANRGH